MKKIFSILAIALVFVSVGYAQTPTIHFDNGKYDMVLHPQNANGVNKETITFTAYDAITQETTFKKVDIEYQVVNPGAIAYENRKMINNFAATELIGIGAGIVGGAICYAGAKYNSEAAVYAGGALCIASGITCIIGYIPLLRNNVYVSQNGIGVKYRIKSH